MELRHPPRAFVQDGGFVVEGWLDADEFRRAPSVLVLVRDAQGAVAFERTVACKAPLSNDHIVRPPGSRLPSRPIEDTFAKYSVIFHGMPPNGSIVSVALASGGIDSQNQGTRRNP